MENIFHLTGYRLLNNMLGELHRLPLLNMKTFHLAADSHISTYFIKSGKEFILYNFSGMQNIAYHETEQIKKGLSEAWTKCSTVSKVWHIFGLWSKPRWFWLQWNSPLSKIILLTWRRATSACKLKCFFILFFSPLRQLLWVWLNVD